MPKYMLLTREPNGPPPFSPAEFEQIMQRYFDWSEQLAQRTKVLAIGGLPKEQARVLRGKGTEVLITDGPFMEANEVLGGYWIFEAADIEEAVTFVQDHPHMGFGLSVELRLLVDPR